MQHRIRRSLGALALCGGTVLAFAAPATAQTSDLVGDRKVTVAPATGLKDGDTVTVTWSGYKANSKLAVIQCADGSGLKPEICNTGAAKFDTPAGNGSGSVELVVHTGETGPDGVCGAQANTCVIAVNEDLVDGVTAIASISFAADAAAPELAATGSSTTPLAFGALALVAIGGVLVAQKRRAHASA
jgi:LPXTG-motif cell wall-anchored protein